MRIFLAALLTLCACLTAQAQSERILDFSSRILVEPDGSMVVTETIIVQATGAQIKRGIVREFPTLYRDSDGSRVRIGFTLMQDSLDGVVDP